MNNKKIGCVVIMHEGQNNYGSSLQGFATISKMQLLGYPCEIIRYKKKITPSYILQNGAGLILSGGFKMFIYRLKKKRDFRNHKKYAETRAIRRKAVDKFKAKHLDSISQFYIGFEDLRKGSLNYSAVMVGSDQVWGPLSLYSKFYNLLFVDNSVPKFSYASSFGVSQIFPWQKKGVKGFLNRMDAIGVRELRGKEIVDSLSNNTAKVVLDPTFLLTKDEWDKNINKNRCTIDEPYILCYVLGTRSEIRTQINKLKEESDLKIVYLPHIDNYIPMDDNMGDIQLFDVDPFDFLNLVKNASYVITDSFHGSVFSILFHKKFITFYREDPKNKKSTHSRIDSLFKIFGLKKRLYKSNIYKEMDADIDYDFVDTKLTEIRKDSETFLKDSLKLSKN